MENKNKFSLVGLLCIFIGIICAIFFPEPANMLSFVILFMCGVILACRAMSVAIKEKVAQLKAAGAVVDVFEQAKALEKQSLMTLIIKIMFSLIQIASPVIYYLGIFWFLLIFVIDFLNIIALVGVKMRQYWGALCYYIAIVMDITVGIVVIAVFEVFSYDIFMAFVADLTLIGIVYQWTKLLPDLSNKVEFGGANLATIFRDLIQWFKGLSIYGCIQISLLALLIFRFFSIINSNMDSLTYIDYIDDDIMLLAVTIFGTALALFGIGLQRMFGVIVAMIVIIWDIIFETTIFLATDIIILGLGAVYLFFIYREKRLLKDNGPTFRQMVAEEKKKLFYQMQKEEEAAAAGNQVKVSDEAMPDIAVQCKKCNKNVGSTLTSCPGCGVAIESDDDLTIQFFHAFLAKAGIEMSDREINDYMENHKKMYYSLPSLQKLWDLVISMTSHF